MKHPAPRFYLKWHITTVIAVQENNDFLVFSTFLIKLNKIVLLKILFLYIFFLIPYLSAKFRITSLPLLTQQWLKERKIFHLKELCF